MKLGVVFPGGGTRGIITAKLLAELDNRISKLAIANGKTFKGIGDISDYLAGTSIGSIIASAIATGYSSEEIYKIFADNAGKILEKSSILPFNKPYYSCKNLEKIIDEKFGEQTIGETDTKLLMTSYNLKRAEQTIFTNFGTEAERSKMIGYAWGIDNIKLKDIVAASAAVPGVFRSKEIEYARDASGIQIYHEIDGGMQNNSPVMDLVLSMHLLEKIDFKDMCVISIGTGTIHKTIMEKMQSQGIVSHIFNIKDILVARHCSVQETAENQAKLLIEANGGRFFKLDPEVSLDDYVNALNDSPKQMSHYEQITDNYISMNDSYLNEVAQQIVDHYCL